MSALLSFFLFLATPQVAHASTVISLTGAGNVEIGASGTIYFNASELELTDLVLIAAEEIRLNQSLPEGLGDDFEGSIGIEGVTEVILPFLEGDVYIETFDFAGSVELRARSIHSIGSFRIDGSLTLIVDIDAIEDDDPNPSGGQCDSTSGSGLIISDDIITNSHCRASIWVIRSGGSTTQQVTLEGSIIIVVPEPASNALGYIALLVLGGLAPHRWRGFAQGRGRERLSAIGATFRRSSACP